MCSNRFHVYHDQNAQQNAESSDHKERCMPAEMIGQQQPYRYTQYLAGRKGHLYKAHYTTSYFHFEQVCNNGKTHGTHYSTKQTGNDPRYEQEMVIRRYRTEKGAHNKTGVKEHQQFFTVKFVGKAGSQQA